MITPAVYWSAIPGPMTGRNRCLNKSYPRKAMLRGFTTQLMNRVTNSPLGRLPMRVTEVKSIFIIMGTIMSQMSTAIGALIWLRTELDPTQPGDGRGREAAKGHARDHADGDPEAPVALEDVQPLRFGRFGLGRDHLAGSLIGHEPYSSIWSVLIQEHPSSGEGLGPSRPCSVCKISGPSPTAPNFRQHGEPEFAQRVPRRGVAGGFLGRVVRCLGLGEWQRNPGGGPRDDGATGIGLVADHHGHEAGGREGRVAERLGELDEFLAVPGAPADAVARLMRFSDPRGPRRPSARSRTRSAEGRDGSWVECLGLVPLVTGARAGEVQPPRRCPSSRPACSPRVAGADHHDRHRDPRPVAVGQPAGQLPTGRTVRLVDRIQAGGQGVEVRRQGWIERRT